MGRWALGLTVLLAAAGCRPEEAAPSPDAGADAGAGRDTGSDTASGTAAGS